MLNPGDLHSAQQFLEQAVRLDPNFATAWALLAQVHASIFFGEDDATQARRAAARTALDTAVRLQPGLAEVQLAQGIYQYRVERDYDGARRSFEALHAKWPNNADIVAALGYIARRQGRWEEGKAYLDQALALDPLRSSLWGDAIYIRIFTRDFSGALRVVDDALNRWPDDIHIAASKAGIYQALGRLDEADAVLKALHAGPQDIDVIFAIAYQAILQRRYPEAIDRLQALLESTQPAQLPGLTASYLNQELGDLRRLSGDAAGASANYVRARDQLLAALPHQPDNLYIYLGLAQVYCGLGDREAAMKYAERGVALMPVSKDALDGTFAEETLARVAARFGDRDRAIPLLARLLKMPGDFTPALLRLDPDFDKLRGDPRFEALVAGNGGQ